MTDTYRIVLADDHNLFRRGLKGIIESTAGFEVIGEAVDGLELLRLLRTTSPDMVIVDISMPNIRGIEAVREIRKGWPDMKVLILTMHKDQSYLHEAIIAGAQGYLLKEDTDPELFSAIERVRQGKIYVSPNLSENLIEDLAHRGSGRVSRPFGPDALTTREKEVLKLIAESKSSREVADLLCISVRTVERHRANILDKLRIKRTADLVKYAIRKGYV